MRLNRRLLLLPGIAAIIASIALGGISFSTLADPGVALAGEPTTAPTEESRPKSHTPTVKPTEAVVTEAPSTSTPVPPTVAAPTRPSGGAEGSGLRPPNTGTGDAGSSGTPWLLVAGGFALAAFGIGSTAFGLRRR